MFPYAHMLASAFQIHLISLKIAYGLKDEDLAFLKGKKPAEVTVEDYVTLYNRIQVVRGVQPVQFP